MNRREALGSIAGSVAGFALTNPVKPAAVQPQRSKKLGIARFSYSIRSRAERLGNIQRRITGPVDFLKHAHSVRAGGIQDRITNANDAHQLRRYAENYGLFVEGSTSLPRNERDVDRFESHLRTATTAGATVVRIAIGGRRYEQFDRREQYEAFAERAWQSIQLAEPVAARHRIRLAIENHKDFRVPQMLRMLEKLDSEYVGICLDTGNSFALLEDPMDVVRTYAPWAHSVHVKDMAVREYTDGFLLADVPIGKGLLDLPEMVRIIRNAKPQINFSLEMATRDPLEVPCLTEEYWATFTDVSGAALARTLRYVRDNAASEAALPRVSHLSQPEQVALEEQHIKQCLRYAAENLNL